MEVTLGTNEIRINFEGRNEETYVKVLLERLEYVFKPTYITWKHGIEVKGRTDD